MKIFESFADFLKLFTYAFAKDPLSRKIDSKLFVGAGFPQPDMPDIRNADALSSGSNGFIRVQNDLIDLTQTTNRGNRYKEYDRLVVSVPEIEMAMTVFADEACIAGTTEIATVYDGFKPINWLATNKKEQFLVYCYDFDNFDYTIGWAFAPRLVKKAKTVELLLDDGSSIVITPDHQILKSDKSWEIAENIKFGDELMAFHKVKANYNFTKLKVNQFPRIYTFKKGWIHERQFIDEWRTGRSLRRYENVNKVARMIAGGLTHAQSRKIEDFGGKPIYWLRNEGFTFKELRHLANKYLPHHRVIGKLSHAEIDVYDLSVQKHFNFCTRTSVMHNCQKDEDGRVFKIKCSNDEIVEELIYTFFNRNMLNFDQRTMWDKAKRLFIKGDEFWEIIINPDNPKEGVYKVQDLAPDTMYRIETTKGKLMEFQQSREGPDYQALQRPVTMTTDTELAQANAIRFTPDQVIHLRTGDYRKSFYPYGVSLIEAARGPAHQLKMMEDSMIIYRLCLAGDTRIRTSTSYKHIKDLEINDIVYSYTENGKQIPTKVKIVKNNGKQKIYEVKSKHINIKGNETHPILVNRGGVYQYVDIKDLIPGKNKDKFILTTRNNETLTKISRIYGETYAKLPKNIKTKSKINSITKQFLGAKKALPLKEAKEICETFNIDCSELLLVNKREIHSERINVPEYVTEEFAKLFGFICGDGSIDVNKLFFASSEDIKINKYYSDLLKKYFGKVKFELDKRSEKKLGKYIVNSKTACEIFFSLGYIHNHHKTRIPEWVFTSPKSIRRAFVEGLSDADGCERYTKKGTWFSTIELCNEKLIEDVKEVWSSIGLCSGKLKKRIRENNHLLEGRKLPETTTSYSVTISDNLLPKEENINSVKPVGKEEVYDITVDSKYSNFIANGIVAHNTRAPERRIFYIDVGQLPSFKVEAFVERMKDQFKKKKVISNRNTQMGPSAVDEKFHVPAVDEDYWIPIRTGSNTRIDTLPGACLDLKTKIPLLDGRILTLEELIKEHDSGKTNWAYSCNPETGEPVPGKITWAGITRKNTQVLKITLDDNNEVICTPDHKFPIIGKGKVEAKNLQIGESLIPFNTRLEKIYRSKGKYLQIYNNDNKKWEFVHRMVAEHMVGTNYEQKMIFNENNINLERKVIHHSDFNKFNNTPENLFWMSWKDHKEFHKFHIEKCKENISKGLKLYHQNLSEEEKRKRNEIFAKKALNGNRVVVEKLKNDPVFRKEFIEKQKEGWIKAKVEKKELHEARGKKITARNLEFWSDPENKKKVFVKQTIVYPKQIMDKLMKLFVDGHLLETALPIINNDKELINFYVEVNKHIKREVDFSKGINREHTGKMVKAYGYKGVRHARREANNYNHKIVKIEWLEEKIDTGTITIDGNEELHGFHTFAIVNIKHDTGVYILNSNLSEIDDSLYFRNKLFVALNFPKNYFSLEDPNATRITLSAQDIKFARMIERLQGVIEDGLWEVADRHLKLRGYPPESYEDLTIKMTPPSDWRELSRAEVVTNRINNANSIKGSQLMSDYDILTKWMRYTEDEANEIIARVKIQKLEDLKLQLLGQNPQLLGVGIPGQGGQEISAQPGGPSPMLGMEQQPPGGQPPQPGLEPTPPEGEKQEQKPSMLPQKEQAKPLSEPKEDDIIKYNLELQDYEAEQDEEEIDFSET